MQKHYVYKLNMQKKNEEEKTGEAAVDRLYKWSQWK